jgi:hypothetical protein
MDSEILVLEKKYGREKTRVRTSKIVDWSTRSREFSTREYGREKQDYLPAR